MWSLLIDQPRPGWENMAIDCALLELAGEGAAFVRLYRWEPHCLSFGRHEPAATRYDRERIRQLELACVRRPTGGRAVWHARELTYAVAAPLALFGGLKPAYRQIHSLLGEALASLGARAELALRPAAPPALSQGPCFNSAVGGEVLLQGMKAVGSAQLRQGDAFLQHGSLLLEDDQSLPRSLAGISEAGHEVPLSRVLDRPVSFAEAADAIARRAEAAWGPLQREAGLPGPVAVAARRHAGRFQDEAWTWCR